MESKLAEENHSRTASETKVDESPVALLLYTDLMFGVELQSMARKAGFRFVSLRPGAAIPVGDVLVVDMAARGDWQEAIREAHERGITVVAFGSHTDTEARRAAKEAGAGRVLANSNLARDLPGILVEIRQRRDKTTGARIDGAD